MSKVIATAILSFVLSIVCAMLANASGRVVLMEPAGAGQGFHIYTINPDGTGIRRLTKEPGRYENPRWSPDGTKVIYNKMDGVRYQLWMVNADGSSPELLHEPAYWGASWSPDGEKIAFTTNGEVAIMDLQTREVTPLVEGFMPVWSPDGNAIAYEPPRLPSTMLHLIDPETKRKWNIDLKEEGLDILHKHWSPITWSEDGERIAFLGTEAAKNWWGIYIMDSDGANVIEKYTGDAGDLVAAWPTWSPDGKQILFETPKGIEQMDVDGKSPTLVYEGGMRPHWTRFSVIAVDSWKGTAVTWGYVRRKT